MNEAGKGIHKWDFLCSVADRRHYLTTVLCACCSQVRHQRVLRQVGLRPGDQQPPQRPRGRRTLPTALRGRRRDVIGGCSAAVVVADPSDLVLRVTARGDQGDK